MKSLLALSAALAATVSAVPLVEFQTKPVTNFETGPIAKPMIGGLSLPTAYTTSLQTKAAPVNYGNLNLGTGMMPSQIVHYGTENQPDRSYISPKLVSTTGQDVDFQIAKAEHARKLVNLAADVGKLDYQQFSKYIDLLNEDFDEDFDEDPAKWGWGGWGRRWGHGWGGWGRGWGRHWGGRWGRWGRRW